MIKNYIPPLKRHISIRVLAFIFDALIWAAFLAGLVYIFMPPL